MDPELFEGAKKAVPLLCMAPELVEGAKKEPLHHPPFPNGA